MATQVIMPQLGESVIESKVSRWLKQVGDEIEQHEPILEVETEKVTTEVTATASGVLLAILVEEGVTVQAGAPLAYIGRPGEAIEELAPIQTAVSELPPWEQPGPGDLFKPADEVMPPVPPSGPVVPHPRLPGDELVPHTTIRRSIAEHMVRSKHTSPHATTFFEVDMSRVVTHHQANKTTFEGDGARLTFTTYFVAAAVAALRSHPLVNSTFTEEGILVHRQINIGIAVSLGADGLIVPVLKGADQLDLPGIACAVNDLANRARSKKLRPDEVKEATFAITNHGVAGSLFATPIISQPNVGILSVGALQKRPVVVTQDGIDTIAIKPMIYIGLTFDHRVLDGASADAFLATLKETLERWR